VVLYGPATWRDTMKGRSKTKRKLFCAPMFAAETGFHDRFEFHWGYEDAMNAEQLRERQAPLKDRYRREPETAIVRFRSSGILDQARITCDVSTSRGLVQSGLHPAAGGQSESSCSGDLLLDALVACAGVTLSAVATAMNIEIRSGKVTAEADFDFRGTLGVDKEVPVGLANVRLGFELETDAEDAQIEKLIKLAERYCVIYQTLQQSPQVVTAWTRKA